MNYPTFLRIVIIGLLALCTVEACCAGDLTPALHSADEIAVARLKLDAQQQDFNRDLEFQKLKMERMKAWITGASLMVPLMVAAITFALGVRNQNQQAKLQREAQQVSERAQFELKAAEVVLHEKGPVGARNKALALKALFPQKLPDDFVTTFDPREFEGPKGESYEAKKVFFEMAAPKAKDIESLRILWKQLFPADEWTERIGKDAEPLSSALATPG